MAYSDYGGYAYKNRVRVEDRSDTVLTPDGVQSTPGQWPGWTLEAGRNGGSYHALLGDGPIFVSLYKQSSIGIHRLGEELCAADYLVDPKEGDTNETEWRGELHRYIVDDNFRDDRPAVIQIDDYRITVYWTDEDNYYLYVQLEQPDGTIWHGFSGYGVGAGLEDAGYGYSTDEREETLWDLFPEKEKA